MKLATLHDGSRDGQLVVVSRDLALAHHATGLAGHLRQVLDDWNFISPQLEDLYATLNGGKARHAFAFDPRLAMAPLPRTALRAAPEARSGAGRALRLQPAPGDGLGGATGGLPRGGLARQGGASDRHGATDAHDTDPMHEPAGLVIGVGLAVISGDLPAGCDATRALDGVRLLMLAADVREAAMAGDNPDVAAEGPVASLFGPVAVTPDELGDGWQHGRAALRLELHAHGRRIAEADAAEAMAWSFGDLVAALARWRALGAGTLVASGPLLTGATGGSAVRIEAIAADGSQPLGAIAPRRRAVDGAADDAVAAG